jgi:hypothetical protein
MIEDDIEGPCHLTTQWEKLLRREVLVAVWDSFRESQRFIARPLTSSLGCTVGVAETKISDTGFLD